MKILLISLICLLICCQTRIENNIIKDLGKKQISNNVYIKKMSIGKDRIYFLVDENDNLISSGISTSFTISNGKSSTTNSNTTF
jgi:hypothetical protein